MLRLVSWRVRLTACVIGCWLLLACIVEERKFDADFADQRAAAEDDFGDADDSGGSRAPEPSELCREYCDEVMENCTGEFAVYASDEACWSLCSFLPEEDDEDGNNVQCRLRQAKLAGSTGEADVHCPAAGPGGNDQGTAAGCGSNCESYCMLHPEICSKIEDEPILEMDECMRRCSGLPNDKHFDADFHHDGDNVQCRLVHLSSASISDDAAEVHCWHARITPRDESPCANLEDFEPRCDQYCDLVMVSCSGERAVYDSKKQCMSACELLPKGKSTDTLENTVGCRRYHAYSALEAPEVHCSHASPAGDGHCGEDNCESYCSIIQEACADDYAATFADDDECLSECRKLQGAEADEGYSVDTAPSGDNVQCRIYHAVLAAEDEGECGAALGGGDCQ